MIPYLVVAGIDFAICAVEATERSARATARSLVITAEHDEAFVVRRSYARARATYHVAVVYGPRGGRHVRATEGREAQRLWKRARAG